MPGGTLCLVEHIIVQSNVVNMEGLKDGDISDEVLVFVFDVGGGCS